MQWMSRFFSAFIYFAICSTVFADTNDAGIKVNWGYKGNIGPERWGQLADAFAQCALGKEQSPINIIPKAVAAAHTLSFNYHPATAYLLEDGATDLLLGNTHTFINTGHGVQANFHTDSHESMVFDKTEYRLVQFHFHSPSETLLHGQAYPLEIHFVHNTPDGKAAVVAVFVKAGDANPELQPLIEMMPIAAGKEVPLAKKPFNPANLLPAITAYYTFAGSLTTPPCSEGIKWIVLPTAITASPAQIAIIRKESGGMNARPVQSLNKRTLYITNSSGH